MSDPARDLQAQTVLLTIAENIRIRAAKNPPPPCTLSTRLVADVVLEELARVLGGDRLSEGGPNYAPPPDPEPDI